MTKKELRSKILDMSVKLAQTSREGDIDKYKIALDEFYDELTKLLKIK